MKKSVLVSVGLLSIVPIVKLMGWISWPWPTVAWFNLAAVVLVAAFGLVVFLTTFRN